MKIKSKIRDYEVKFSNNLNFNYDYYLIDKIVYKLHYKKFKFIDKDKIIFISAHEENKAYLRCAYYIQNLIDAGLKRGNTLCAIGGGITQDISGFISSILYRGVDWVFYPTTLLAQCDSCIGGKTSINLSSFKNIVGNFNPPKEIIVNTDFLATLKCEEIQSGIGEIIKVAFLDNEKRIDYNDIINSIKSDHVAIDLIKKSLQIKKEIIEIDEFDKGLRNIMNYGHTFGHAIEALTKFNIPHGIAVGLGVDIANNISKLVFNDNSAGMDSVLKSFLAKNRVYVSTFADYYNQEKYIQILKKDKKNTDAKSINCILNNFKGSTIKKKINVSELKVLLTESIRHDK